VAALDPAVPPAAREDAIRQVRAPGPPVLLAANRHLHRLLVAGVLVQYQPDGETRGDFVPLVDGVEPARNDWLAVKQAPSAGRSTRAGPPRAVRQRPAAGADRTEEPG